MMEGVAHKASTQDPHGGGLQKEGKNCVERRPLSEKRGEGVIERQIRRASKRISFMGLSFGGEQRA